jgi:hypothetical protein
MMKRLLQKIFSGDILVINAFISSLMFAVVLPYNQKAIFSVLPEKYYSMSVILECIGVVVYSKLWNTYREKLYKRFVLFSVLDSLHFVVSLFLYLLTKSIVVYYIIDTILFTIFSRNVISGCNTLLAKRYSDPEKRNCYDNNIASVSGVATILGSSLSILVSHIGFIFVVVIITILNLIDNILFIVVKIKQDKHD